MNEKILIILLTSSKMKIIYNFIVLLFLSVSNFSIAQTPVDLKAYDKDGEARVTLEGDMLYITWPTGEIEKAKVIFSLKDTKPLFRSFQLGEAVIRMMLLTDLILSMYG